MNAGTIALFIVACILRVAGNMYYAGMEERLWAYWWGRNLFEVLAIIVVVLIAKGVPRALVTFFLGLAVYSSVKELYCPVCLEWNEYIGFFIGGFLFVAQILKHVRDRKKLNRYYKH